MVAKAVVTQEVTVAWTAHLLDWQSRAVVDRLDGRHMVLTSISVKHEDHAPFSTLVANLSQHVKRHNKLYLLFFHVNTHIVPVIVLASLAQSEATSNSNHAAVQALKQVSQKQI